MTLSAAVITTFPDNSWDVYSKLMLESFVANWPAEVPILIKTDSGVLAPEINKIIRSYDGLQIGWEKDHQEFVERNKDKDDPKDYRKQVVRFCHKVFAIKYALDSINRAKAAKEEGVPRHLIWLDADVLTTRKVSIQEIQACLPKEGDAVSYMGRKDWPHSECGWLAFDLDNGGSDLIQSMFLAYTSDNVLKMDQWHDSWVFDKCTAKKTNLTPNATGMEVWPQSPMAAWSRHYKGPIAKAELNPAKTVQNSTMQPLKIQTKNSIPNDDICRSILENQTQIKNWIVPCRPTDEEIVVVSAGPMLIAEDLQDEIDAGRKIVAVKHALNPLKEAGIKPWACILLDPREHVADFVNDPDTDIIWLVASQVTPKAVKKLLDAGCNVWGYHASVGAGEGKYTEKQPNSIVNGGSATSTRGLSVLDVLGFKKFRLYGYDLCFDKKPNLAEKDQLGQPVNFEIEMSYQMPHYKNSRWFWSKGELLAQADEFRQIMETRKWEIKAFGNGIVPFLYNIQKINDLRASRKIVKLQTEPIAYEELLACNSKARFLTPWRNMLRKILRKPIKANSFFKA